MGGKGHFTVGYGRCDGEAGCYLDGWASRLLGYIDGIVSDWRICASITIFLEVHVHPRQLRGLCRYVIAHGIITQFFTGQPQVFTDG